MGDFFYFNPYSDIDKRISMTIINSSKRKQIMTKRMILLLVFYVAFTLVAYLTRFMLKDHAVLGISLIVVWALIAGFIGYYAIEDKLHLLVRIAFIPIGIALLWYVIPVASPDKFWGLFSGSGFLLLALSTLVLPNFVNAWSEYWYPDVPTKP